MARTDSSIDLPIADTVGYVAAIGGQAVALVVFFAILAQQSSQVSTIQLSSPTC
jgi:hypothetical protein